eukprot:scaffold2330_cov376-Prasinococcus_capsulatus_cf.AAC.1
MPGANEACGARSELTLRGTGAGAEWTVRPRQRRLIWSAPPGRVPCSSHGAASRGRARARARAADRTAGRGRAAERAHNPHPGHARAEE